MADDMDFTGEQSDEQPMCTGENVKENWPMESNHAMADDQGNGDNNGYFLETNTDKNYADGIPSQEDSPMPDPFDDLEQDDDDITSKLLSIQVLPRIPKRKPETDEGTKTSIAESSSYCSVLERVNVATTSKKRTRYPNWSAAGWNRSNVDRPAKRWNQNQRDTKDNKTERKLPKVVQNKKDSHADAKNQADVVHSKTKGVIDQAAWSPLSPRVIGSTGVSDVEHLTADEDTALTLTGPLPTLPFEEQMRERARRRKLKQLGPVAISNSSSTDVLDSEQKDFDFSDGSNATFPVDSHFVKDNHNKPLDVRVHREEIADSRMNVSNAFQSNSGHRHELVLQSHENGHSHSHKATNRSSRTYFQGKSGSLSVSTLRETNPAQSFGDELMLKSRQVSSSPPLPHLPVLPLFAAVSSDSATSKKTENVTVQSERRKFTTVPLSETSRGTSVKQDCLDTGSLNTSKPQQPSLSASGPASKTVSFSSNTKLEDSRLGRKKKSKTKFQYEDKKTMQQCVIGEMKEFLKPYYSRRRITKEQYKEIMRCSVTRICRGCPPAGEISASRVRKYAEAYLDKALHLNVGKSGARQEKSAA